MGWSDLDPAHPEKSRHIAPWGRDGDAVDVQRAIKKIRQEMRSLVAFHVDKPAIDYVHVEDAWRERGIGLALYHHAAWWCQSQGMSLRASLIQSGEAQACWSAMKRKSWCTITSVSMTVDERRGCSRWERHVLTVHEAPPRQLFVRTRLLNRRVA